MRLSESHAESFELLHASICNALTYAEDLMRDKQLREALSPVVVKLKWIKSGLELKIPPSRRTTAKEKDHLFYDELLRCATHMDDDRKKKLEQFINQNL